MHNRISYINQTNSYFLWNCLKPWYSKNLHFCFVYYTGAFLNTTHHSTLETFCETADTAAITATPVCDKLGSPNLNQHSFIPLACAECSNSLPFSGASSIPLCYVLFPATLLHQLFVHPLSPHLAIHFLVSLSILLFPNLNQHITVPIRF